MKHKDYIVNLLQQIETGENFSKSTLSHVSKRLKTNWNKKGENSRPYIIWFKTLKHIDYLVNLLQQIETGEIF